MARISMELGVSRVWADRLIPCGAGAGLERLAVPETRELFEIMREAREEARRSWFCRTEVAMHRALQFLVGGGQPYRCRAGDTLLAIGADGVLVPCRRMPVPVGNVLEKSIQELYEQAPLLKALRDAGRAVAGCRGCFYEGACRGGLRCLSYAVTMDPFQADPDCWVASQGQVSLAPEPAAARGIVGEATAATPGGERS